MAVFSKTRVLKMANVLTLAEVADYLRINRSTVYRLIKGGTLPGFKIGSDWRFNIESIDRWRAQAERGGSSSFAALANVRLTHGAVAAKVAPLP
jgi:excisionase family DNA binding protein